MRYVNHQFFPSHTIAAAVRFYNGITITQEEMSKLLKGFNELNPDMLPRIGIIAKIPLLDYITPDNVEIFTHDQ